MDVTNKEPYKLSKEYIDRIFLRLTEIYGERFTGKFEKPERLEMEKTRWRGGLYGLSSDEIRKVLNMCLNNLIKEPPSWNEFFHYAKNYKSPPPIEPKRVYNLEVGKQHLLEIKQKLKGGYQSVAR